MLQNKIHVTVITLISVITLFIICKPIMSVINLNNLVGFIYSISFTLLF